VYMDDVLKAVKFFVKGCKKDSKKQESLQ
jgi:hypothetical protein